MESSVLTKLKPYLAMVSVQFGYAGMNIITMLSLKHGMSHYILAVYRHAVATLVIAPFAIYFERKTRPKMTFPVFLRIMLLAFLEPVLDQNLYYVGMKYTSATFASAIVNVLPAVTFIMAIIFRLESVNLKKLGSIAKVGGTAVTVTGAMIMTMYKGPLVDIIHGNGPVGVDHAASNQSNSDQHWVTGTLMLLCSCCGWAAFFIVQSFTLKKYPAELSLSGWICLMGMVEGAAVSLAMERDMSAWVLGWDLRLLAAAYTGVVCSGIAYYLQGVVIKEKGPVFVTSFSPLIMIITAALGAIILAEKVHLGSVIGAILIVAGLYTVVWGKSKDQPNSNKMITEGEESDGVQLPITLAGKSATPHCNHVDPISKPAALSSHCNC